MSLYRTDRARAGPAAGVDHFFVDLGSQALARDHQREQLRGLARWYVPEPVPAQVKSAASRKRLIGRQRIQRVDHLDVDADRGDVTDEAIEGRATSTSASSSCSEARAGSSA